MCVCHKSFHKSHQRSFFFIKLMFEGVTFVFGRHSMAMTLQVVSANPSPADKAGAGELGTSRMSSAAIQASLRLLSRALLSLTGRRPHRRKGAGGLLLTISCGREIAALFCHAPLMAVRPGRLGVICTTAPLIPSSPPPPPRG
jgi:hypothetical protein